MSIKKVTFTKDYKQTKSLVAAGEEAATKAVRHAKALDLTITYIENGVVYEEDAEGTKIPKKTILKKENPFTLIKGMVLHAK